MAPDYMMTALKLAVKGRNFTRPNPMVGAVIVKQGTVIGRGYHQRAGGAHAEAAAIKEAGAEAEGAVLYVTMEPCSIRGRTPPCAEQIIRAGIRKVVIGALDPNPMVAGRGREALAGAGVEVVVDETHAAELKKLNEIYHKYITTGLPFLLAKTALSIDGKISRQVGARTKISSDEAKREVHKLRGQADAVVVGVNTIIYDNPRLTVRQGVKCLRPPARIVLDTKARTPMTATVVATAKEIPTYIVTSADADAKALKGLRRAGVNIIYSALKNGKIDLLDFLAWAGKQQFSSLLVEGGAGVFSSFVAQALPDKYIFIISPLIFGGDSMDLVDSKVVRDVRFNLTGVKQVGRDVWLEAYPRADR